MGSINARLAGEADRKSKLAKLEGGIVFRIF
jgi:hypothetical protein